MKLTRIIGQLEELKRIRSENDELKARLVNLLVRVEQLEKVNRR